MINAEIASQIVLIYFLCISFISAVVCIYDKLISKKGRVELRIPEQTLILLSVLGGAVAMYVTMLLIRHKTKHKKFMIGVPLIIVLHVALIIAAINFLPLSDILV